MKVLHALCRIVVDRLGLSSKIGSDMSRVGRVQGLQLPAHALCVSLAHTIPDQVICCCNIAARAVAPCEGGLAMLAWSHTTSPYARCDDKGAKMRLREEDISPGRRRIKEGSRANETEAESETGACWQGPLRARPA